MRILALRPERSANPAKLKDALRGLAARGHELHWLGDGSPRGEGIEALHRLRELHHRALDVVVSPGRPAGAAWTAWRVGAHAVLLATGASDMGKWNVLDRIGWDASRAHALIDEREADAIVSAARPADLDRFGLWSSAEPGAPGDPDSEDVEVLERACERLLARRTGRQPRPAVFVDRDGTLIVERGYLGDPDGVELLPGVVPALRKLRAARIPVVVVSNQSGIGRGRFTRRRAHEVMARLRRLLRSEGVELDAIYFCPHAPEYGCACRKPGTALLERAAEDQLLLLRASVVVGDKRLDAQAGQAMGGYGALVRTGYGGEEAVVGGEAAARAPDLVTDSLEQAADWFIAGLEANALS